MKGSAIIAAFILIVIGSLIVAGYLSYMTNEARMTKMLNDSTKALYIAEAGLEQKCYEIVKKNNADILTTYFPDQADDESYYFVNVAQNGNVYTVTSTGSYHGSTRVIQQNVSIFYLWDTAFFSQGSVLGEIHGNTQIRGTVYVMGEESFIDKDADGVFDSGDVDENNNGVLDHLKAKEPDLQKAIIAGSEFYIGNNYAQLGGRSGIPQTFIDRRPEALPPSLGASLNVKYGLTDLTNGNAQVGSSDTPMDLINVPDGFPEGQVINGHIYVEEGGLLYDRGMFNDKIRVPNLQDVVDVDNGTTRFDLLKSNALVLTPNVNGFPEDITPVTGGTENPFNYSDTKGNSFVMDGAGNMIINGIIFIDGNFSIDRYRSARTIKYTGKGTIVTNGNFTINVNFYPAAEGESAFPTNNIVGFISSGNTQISMNDGANLEIMSIFYAGGTLKDMKQSTIGGALIANHIDISKNVPSIFQIPGIRDALPPGFENIDNVVVTVYGWHEVFD